MRKITKEAAQAFINGVPYSKSNMVVTYIGDTMFLLLHGNIIAKRGTTDNANAVIIGDGGWQTTTTKERLNGLLQLLDSPFFIVQRNYRWYVTDGKTKVPWESGYTVQHWLEELNLV